MSENAKVVELKPEPTSQDKTLKAFFIRLKTIRNISLGVGLASTGVMVGASYKPIGPLAMTLAATVTTLALSTAATAQLLLSLNEQLEAALNQPTRKPGPAS
ncbi:MAG: hypothetical protein ACAI44_14600 [Candidatus Sericytochromatia bacterium]